MTRPKLRDLKDMLIQTAKESIPYQTPEDRLSQMLGELVTVSGIGALRVPSIVFIVSV